MSARPFKAQKPSCFNVKNLILEGKPHVPTDYKTRPTLRVSVSESGNPKIQVYSNDLPGDTRSINIGFKLNELFTLFQTIRKVAASEEPSKYSFIMSAQFRNNQRLETPVREAVIYVGRNQEGLVYLGVQQSPQRPMCVFPFKLGYLIEFLDESGEKAPLAFESSMYANSWCTLYENIVAAYVANIGVDDKASGAQQPQQGGGRPQYQQPQQQPYQQPQQPQPAAGYDDNFDDNIPF